MLNKNNSTNSSIVTEEFKEQNLKYTLSKFEYDLYHEDENIVEKIIRVKRISPSSKNEKWKISENNRIIFTVEGNKLSIRERDFLKTVDGFNFLIAQAKIGIKSLSFLKNEMKKNLK